MHELNPLPSEDRIDWCCGRVTIGLATWWERRTFLDYVENLETLVERAIEQKTLDAKSWKKAMRIGERK